MKREINFGASVRLGRIRTGETLRSMSKFMGVSTSYLNAVETKRRRITRADVEGVKRFFSALGYVGIDWDKLAEETNREPLRDLTKEVDSELSLSCGSNYEQWD